MNQPDQNFLVTGGAGFVGRHVVLRLLRDFPNAQVWVIDDLSTGLAPDQWPEQPLTLAADTSQPGLRKFALPGGSARLHFLQADLMSLLLAELGRVPATLPFKLPAFERTYHFASVVGGRAVIEGDPLAVGIDLAIDSTFFLWAAKVGRPKRILYASSSAAYPVNLQVEDGALALEESMISFEQGSMQPDFTYGWSKLTGEYLGQIAARHYDLNVATVRPFSGYGEYQEPVYPVPAIALRAAARQDPLFVWGTGEQARDFIHIDDCVQAMEQAITTISDGSAVNLGSGQPTSFLQLAALFANIEGYQPKVMGKAGKPVGVAKRFCNPTIMQERLGFRPAISLREGMSRVINVAHKRLDAGVEVPD